MLSEKLTDESRATQSRKNIDKLLVLVGPTCVGKSEMAVQLAERMDGEIISADSRSLYIGMDIGTAKPSEEDRHRIPHHFVDVAYPDQTWTLADFREQLPVVIADIYSRGRIPIIVGGTGQYIRSFLEGWSPPEVAPDPLLRKVLETWANNIGVEGLHQRLAVIDPAAALNIDPHNLRRIVRALEVILSSGHRFSDLRKKSPLIYDYRLIGLTLPRAELFERIDIRIEKMFDSGFVDEVRKLLEFGYSTDLPSFSAIGYRQVADYLKGNITLVEAKIIMKRHTRTLVRRQLNWWKASDKNIYWFQVKEGVIDEIIDLLQHWL